MYVCTYVCMYVCMSVCMYACIHTYIYIYACTLLDEMKVLAERGVVVANAAGANAIAVAEPGPASL